MFQKIRKHQTWLLVVVIFITCLGMVMYFGGPGSQYSGRRSQGGEFGSIDNVPITRNDYDRAYREAYVRHLVLYGYNTKSSFDQNAEHETYQRLFWLHKLKEYNIDVDPETVARQGGEILVRAGNGTPLPLDVFVKEALAPRAGAEDFERYIRHEVGLLQLYQILGTGGDLITPQEARSLYVQQHQELATEAVFFVGSNYLASITSVPPDALGRYYTNHIPEYRIKERVQVNYVRFDLSNHLVEVQQVYTNLSHDVEGTMARLGTNYQHFGKTPEEAKKKIGEELVRQRALVDVRRKANAFANELFSIEPVRPENLATLARTNGLTVRLSEPFEEANGPKEFDGGANFGRTAFKLTQIEPFTDQLLTGEDGVYIIAFNKKIPAEVPTLDQIRDKVVADYKRNEAVSLARRTGEHFSQMLTNGLAQGKTFAAVCAEAKVHPYTPPPLSLSMDELPALEERITLNQYKNIAFTTSPGSASDFNPTLDGGLVVYVQKRLPVDEAKLTEGMPSFVRMIRQARRQQAVDAWFQAEAGRIMRIPSMERRSAPSAPIQGGS